MTVSYVLTTRAAPRPSYTTSMDSTHLGSRLRGSVLWEYMDTRRLRALVRYELPGGLTVRRLHWRDELAVAVCGHGAPTSATALAPWDSGSGGRWPSSARRPPSPTLGMEAAGDEMPRQTAALLRRCSLFVLIAMVSSGTYRSCHEGRRKHAHGSRGSPLSWSPASAARGIASVQPAPAPSPRRRGGSAPRRFRGPCEGNLLATARGPGVVSRGRGSVVEQPASGPLVW